MHVYSSRYDALSQMNGFKMIDRSQYTKGLWLKKDNMRDYFDYLSKSIKKRIVSVQDFISTKYTHMLLCHPFHNMFNQRKDLISFSLSPFYPVSVGWTILWGVANHWCSMSVSILNCWIRNCISGSTQLDSFWCDQIVVFICAFSLQTILH